MDHRLEDAILAEKNPVCIDRWRMTMLAVLNIYLSDDVFFSITIYIYTYIVGNPCFTGLADSSPKFLENGFLV